jgi:hypothetical protein
MDTASIRILLPTVGGSMARRTVMISSTVSDLQEHRKQVWVACERAGFAPVAMMDQLSARNEEIVEFALRMVEEADLYIGILAHRYGYVPKGSDLSIVEMEYNLAVKLNKPRLIFFMHDAHPVSMENIETNPEATNKLRALKDRIARERIVAYFRSPEELRAQVTESLGALQARFGDHESNPVDTPDPPGVDIRSGPAVTGASPSWQRDAGSNELGLGIDQYARALATIFRAARGEFCFALFGAWGSGKTTLVRYMTPLLASPEKFTENQISFQHDAAMKLRYTVIWHSAWKYRTAPESWIYLYKSLSDAALKKQGFLERSTIRFAAASELHGIWPITLALSFIAIAAVPLFVKWNILALIASVVGWSTTFGVILASGGTGVRLRDLFRRYGDFSKHNEKLGMLALLGDELRALVKGWIPKALSGQIAIKEDAVGWKLPAAYLTLVAILWAASLIWFGGQTRELVFPIAIVVAWSLVAAALIYFSAARKSRSTDRLLLVIDDLDRCTAEEALDIIEALKLLLEEPAVNRRLQILMLIDEGILRHAIEFKFKNLINNHSPREPENPEEDQYSQTETARRDQLVQEHMEKIFACHLRLPELSGDDLMEIVDIHAGGRTLHDRKTEVSGNETGGAASGPGLPDIPRQGAGTLEGAPTTAQQPHQPDLSVADVRFSADEISELKAKTDGFFKATRQRATHRAVRAFLFKVQLCKLLLRLRPANTGGESFTIGDIVTALQTAGSKSGRDRDVRDSIQSIARQVA